MASGHTPQSGGPTHIGANRRDMTSDTSTAGSVGQKEDLAYIGFHVYEKQAADGKVKRGQPGPFWPCDWNGIGQNPTIISDQLGARLGVPAAREEEDPTRENGGAKHDATYETANAVNTSQEDAAAMPK